MQLAGGLGEHVEKQDDLGLYLHVLQESQTQRSEWSWQNCCSPSTSTHTEPKLNSLQQRLLQERGNFTSAIKLETEPYIQITTAIHTARGLWPCPGMFRRTPEPYTTIVNVHSLKHHCCSLTFIPFICPRCREKFAEVLHLLSSALLQHITIPLIHYGSSVQNTYSPLPNKGCWGCHTNQLRKNSKASLLLHKVLPLNTKECYRRDGPCQVQIQLQIFWNLALWVIWS